MEIWKRNLLVCWFGSFATAAGLSQIAPVLPLYIEHLGIKDTARIEQFSGFAFGVTFILMALVSPLWGRAADKYGRKSMLLRASLGMALVITCMGFVTDVYQLIGLRLIQGAVSGYISAAIILVATQAPEERSGWALGTLSTGGVGGMLLGPLIGGYLAETVGLRFVFFGTGALLLVAFTLSVFFIQENFTASHEKLLSYKEIWRLIPNPAVLICMFVTTFMLQLALLSIEPIITVYIAQISYNSEHVALLSGMVFASSGVANILAAPRLGRLSDKIGPDKVMLVSLILSGLLFFPQAYVTNVWQLMVLRFMFGVGAAGLLPSLNSLVKHNSPDSITGRIFGYNQSAQHLGSFVGSLLGGQIAALWGIHWVFWVTGLLLLLNAAWVYQTAYRTANEEKAT